MGREIPDLIEIEDFLPTSFVQILQDVICDSGEFHWQYNASTNDPKNPQITRRSDKSYDGDQFVHALFQEGQRRSSFFDVVFPMFYFLEAKTGVALGSVERMKANLLVKKDIDPDAHNTPHIDIPDAGFKSLLYYVQDSDGETFIFKETYQSRDAKAPLTIRRRIAPRKGKAVLFDSNIWHASSNPRENATRVVLNFIFRHK